MDANLKKCVSVKDEKLYVLEIFVNSVSLYPEKLDKVDPTILGVDIQFIDVPLFRIFQTEFLLTKPDRSKEVSRDAGYRVVNFNAGKMYTFSRNPGELVEQMRSKPLLLDVYKVKEYVVCPEEVLKNSLGNTKVPLPGCLCDHVMMASNDIYHLPRSYQIKNTYGLIDDEYKPSGYVTIFFRLTCFGTYMTGTFALIQKKLLFKNSGSFNEFLCTKVQYSDEDERRAAEASTKFCLPEKVFEESELDTPPRSVNVAGLVLVCKELSQKDGFPPEVIPPNYPPKIPYTDVEETEFDMDKTRRKGFKEVVSEHPGVVLENMITSEQTGCINIRCPGSICIGKK